MKKEKRGGKREGAGRPKIADRKLQITINVLTSDVNNVGGKAEAKSIAESAISEKSKNITNLAKS